MICEMYICNQNLASYESNLDIYEIWIAVVNASVLFIVSFLGKGKHMHIRSLRLWLCTCAWMCGVVWCVSVRERERERASSDQQLVWYWWYESGLQEWSVQDTNVSSQSPIECAEHIWHCCLIYVSHIQDQHLSPCSCWSSHWIICFMFSYHQWFCCWSAFFLQQIIRCGLTRRIPG